MTVARVASLLLSQLGPAHVSRAHPSPCPPAHLVLSCSPAALPPPLAPPFAPPQLDPADVVIVEGILVLAMEEVRGLRNACNSSR